MLAGGTGEADAGGAGADLCGAYMLGTPGPDVAGGAGAAWPCGGTAAVGDMGVAGSTGAAEVLGTLNCGIADAVAVGSPGAAPLIPSATGCPSAGGSPNDAKKAFTSSCARTASLPPALYRGTYCVGTPPCVMATGAPGAARNTAVLGEKNTHHCPTGVRLWRCVPCEQRRELACMQGGRRSDTR